MKLFVCFLSIFAIRKLEILASPQLLKCCFRKRKRKRVFCAWSWWKRCVGNTVVSDMALSSENFKTLLPLISQIVIPFQDGYGSVGRSVILPENGYGFGIVIGNKRRFTHNDPQNWKRSVSPKTSGEDWTCTEPVLNLYWSTITYKVAQN